MRSLFIVIILGQVPQETDSNMGIGLQVYRGMLLVTLLRKCKEAGFSRGRCWTTAQFKEISVKHTGNWSWNGPSELSQIKAKELALLFHTTRRLSPEKGCDLRVSTVPRRLLSNHQSTLSEAEVVSACWDGLWNYSQFILHQWLSDFSVLQNTWRI